MTTTSYQDLRAAVIAAERARLYVSMPARQYDAERRRQEREIGRHIGEGQVMPVRVSCIRPL